MKTNINVIKNKLKAPVKKNKVKDSSNSQAQLSIKRGGKSRRNADGTPLHANAILLDNIKLLLEQFMSKTLEYSQNNIITIVSNITNEYRFTCARSITLIDFTIPDVISGKVKDIYDRMYIDVEPNEPISSESSMAKTANAYFSHYGTYMVIIAIKNTKIYAMQIRFKNIDNIQDFLDTLRIDGDVKSSIRKYILDSYDIFVNHFQKRRRSSASSRDGPRKKPRN